MKNAHLLLLLALASCAVPLPGGRDLWVLPGEGGEWDDATQVDYTLTFTTIQDAINAALPGDTVNVPAGTYYENLVMAEGVDVDGAGQSETYLVGTVYFSGLADAGLSGMAIFDPVWVSSSTPYTTAYGVGVASGGATLSDLGIYYFQCGPARRRHRRQLGRFRVRHRRQPRRHHLLLAPTPSIARRTPCAG